MSDVLKRLFSVFASESAVAEAARGVSQHVGRNVVCVAVRLRQFDSLVYERSAEDLADLMNSYYTSVATAVLSTNGDLENFCGATVSGFYYEGRFETYQRLATDLQERLGPAIHSLEQRFHARIAGGICAGTLFFGAYGSTARRTVTGFGQPASCASHLADRDCTFNFCDTLGISKANQWADGQVSVCSHWRPDGV